MATNNPIETMPVGKLLFKLSLPSILAQLVSLLYSIVDRIYIGHIADAGSAALSGVGVTIPIIMAINSFSSLIGMGGAPLAAIALGQKNTKKANQILWNCLVYTVITAAVLTVTLLCFKKPILALFGTDDSIYKFASDYFTVCCLGSLFSMGTLVVNQFLLTQGKNKVSMIIVSAGAIFNTIVDPIFIFTLNLGIQGAAIVTVISQIGTTVAGLFFLMKKKSLIRIQPSALSIKILGKVVSLGFATFFMVITESLINTVFNRQLIRYGSAEYIAVLSIIFSINQIINQPVQGINQGAQPIISYSFGARNFSRLKQAIKYCIFWTTILSFSFTIVLEIFAKPVFCIFTTDERLIEIGINALRIFIAGRVFSGVQLGIQTVLRAVGESKRPIIIAMFRKIVLIVPLTYLLPAVTGLRTTAVFMAEPISDVLAQCFAIVVFLLFYNRHLKKCF